MAKNRFSVFQPAGPFTSAPLGHTWSSAMSLALEEARNTQNLGEVPVGAALISPGGEVLAVTGNRVIAHKDPTAHAEMLAIRLGAYKLNNERLCGCVMVATLEPCLMCAAAMIHARIAGIVFGAADSFAGAIISRADYVELTGAGRHIWHMGGVLSADCAALLHGFFEQKRALADAGY